RLVDLLENGETIIQQTRSFDASNGSTFATREKEDADDYRYFPEPDLAPFRLTGEFIEEIKKSIPLLQRERVRKYKSDFQLSEYDARQLTEDRAFSDYFEQVTQYNSNYKAVANWMLGPVRSWLNENEKELAEFPILPVKLAELIQLVEGGKLSFSIASTRLFMMLIKDPSGKADQMAMEHNFIQQSDVSMLEPIIENVLEKYSLKVNEYKKGKKGLLALFVGEVMKQSNGKADPKVTNELLLKKLSS
ncbi:MAG TPA: Asp-tRNA(Asn)/Glu-tRNA(Gln) amidotransferase GatCAB subunit B, partial [Chitinophagaceae bacterium]|nr:Asp-tRNA(Asn)/Glu-tRNA(Gln) amidotransferase GatCAB subunit B [Chitinophagaceae bacterium]